VTIEVTCDCGRVYVLPADKEGRKLQCRRCGAVITIRRDADAGAFVPFKQVAADESDEVTKGPEGSGAGEGRLELKPLDEPETPLRRCPSCGFQDDPAIVICVRCGLDFRAPRGPEKPVPRPARPSKRTAERAKADFLAIEREVDERVARVETFAKVSFVPVVGLVPGLLALALGAVGGDELRSLPAASRKGLESRLGAARLMAVATMLIWLGLLGFYAFVYRPQQKLEIREQLARTCHAHLDSLGRWVREVRDSRGRFPAEARATLADGLRDLADEHETGGAVLSCPLLGGEPYTVDAGLAAIESRTNDEYLILWDSAPHAEPEGALAWYALRADGHVEEFHTVASFEKARSRPSEKFKAAEPAPVVRAEKPKTTAEEVGFETRRQALFQLARELDAADPKLEKPLAEADFQKRVGLSPPDALTQVVRYGDDDLRHVVARIVARLSVPGPEMLRLTTQLAHDADAETRWTLTLALKKAGAPAWLDEASTLATDGLAPFSDQALALLVAEAQSGKEGLKRVLLRARERRHRTNVAAEQPIFALPPAVVGAAVELLADTDVAGEALALLAHGGPDVETALEPAFQSTEPRVRGLAFHALRSNLSWREAPLAPLHERLKTESDRGIRAAVLQTLLDPVDAETVKRAIEAFREGAGTDPLASVCRRIFGEAKDKACLLEMVKELDHPGPARDEVLGELQKPTRVFDETVSAVLAQKVLSFDQAGQETAVHLAAHRFDDGAYRLLLHVAAASTVAPMREAAWKALTDGAFLSDKVRTEIQEELAARLLKEPDFATRGEIVTLLGRYEYRSTAGMNALEQLARRSSEKEDLRERAVAELCVSNDPRSVTILADLIDALTGQPKFLAISKLKAITNAPTQPSTTVEWRRIVHQTESELKKTLREREEHERSEFKNRQDQAEAHVRELRGRS
jgi:hypothetical protein